MTCYYVVGDSGHIFMCGDLGIHCADCGDVCEFLCDYPVGDDKTCDRPMCKNHAHEIASELHYCDSHFVEWQKFKADGGVRFELENVVPFRTKQ